MVPPGHMGLSLDYSVRRDKAPDLTDITPVERPATGSRTRSCLRPREARCARRKVRQLPLELGQRREDAEHEAAARGRGVDLRALAGKHPLSTGTGKRRILRSSATTTCRGSGLGIVCKSQSGRACAEPASRP